MSTTSVAHRPTQRNTFVQPMSLTPVPTDFSSYLAGQRRYMRGEGPDACANANERRGWQDALKYDSDAQTDAYLATVPVWQRDPGPEADYEFIRRGM